MPQVQVLSPRPKNLVKLLTMDQKPAIINRLSPQYAGVAQLVEQLICNQQVGGSSPSTSSTKLKISYGRVPEWPKGADCKSVVSDFGGPNPPSPTRLSLDAIRVQTLFLLSGLSARGREEIENICFLFK